MMYLKLNFPFFKYFVTVSVVNIIYIIYVNNKNDINIHDKFQILAKG